MSSTGPTAQPIPASLSGTRVFQLNSSEFSLAVWWPNRRFPMANVNKVLLIGRLTRDPEVRMFSNGGKVAMFGFAVNNRRKNQQTGQWEDDPVFLDVEAFNRGETGKTADLVEQYLHKGNQAFIEGHLKLDQWT